MAGGHALGPAPGEHTLGPMPRGSTVTGRTWMRKGGPAPGMHWKPPPPPFQGP